MKNFVVILSFFICPFAFSQNIASDSSAPFVAYWKKGEQKEFLVTRKIYQLENKKVVENSITNYSVHLTVKDSTSEGYMIEGVYRYNRDQSKSMPEFEDLLNNLKIVYSTDELGSFTRLLNYEEIKQYVNQIFKKLTQNIKDTAALRFLNEQIVSLFSNQQVLEQVVLKDIALYHTPYGSEFSLTKTVNETHLANFVGDEPWPGTITAGLLNKPSEEIANAYMDLQLDKEKTGKILVAWLKKMATSMGKDISKEDLNIVIDIKDHSEFDLLLKSGWIKRAFVKRVAVASEVTKEDTMIIEMK